MDPIRWHVVQAESHYCVPACACIVARALGKDIDQKELASRWPGSSRGFALKDAAPEISGEYRTFDPTHPQLVAALLEYLSDGALIVAQVFSSAIDRLVRGFIPCPSSPHGRLCAHEFGPLHAIVLIDYDEAGLMYLDPYFEPAGQPFTMTRAEFVHAFQGDVVIAEL
jgi:hypothetical protein